jgi:hypothetical protein
MALLDLIGDVSEQIGLLRPASVISSLDQQVKQLLALANQEGRDLATGDSVVRAFYWSALVKEATFLTVAAETQGAIQTLLPGFRRLSKETFWNRSLRQKVPPITAQAWQEIKAGNINTAYPYFRFVGKNLLFTPTPTAGQTIAVEYHSKNWCEKSDGSVTRAAWADDTDLALLPQELMQQGIVWRWKAAKNFDYAEDYRTYQTNVLQAMANDADSPKLDIAGEPSWEPSIAVPSGSWAIT